jgi:hypothetical protein
MRDQQVVNIASLMHCIRWRQGMEASQETLCSGFVACAEGLPWSKHDLCRWLVWLHQHRRPCHVPPWHSTIAWCQLSPHLAVVQDEAVAAEAPAVHAICQGHQRDVHIHQHQAATHQRLVVVLQQYMGSDVNALALSALRYAALGTR